MATIHIHSTNYLDTFIEVADDYTGDGGRLPPERAAGKTVATIQLALVAAKPYTYTSDDVLFLVHAARQSIPDAAVDEERQRFFSKGQACLRSSPLTKQYGWGIHSDGDGRVALYALGSPDYERLARDPDLAHTKAMRSKRA